MDFEEFIKTQNLPFFFFIFILFVCFLLFCCTRCGQDILCSCKCCKK